MRARIFLSLTAPSTLRQNGSAKISGSPKTEYTSRYAPRHLREANCSLDARRSQPGGGRKPADRKASTIPYQCYHELRQACSGLPLFLRAYFKGRLPTNICLRVRRLNQDPNEQLFSTLRGRSHDRDLTVESALQGVAACQTGVVLSSGSSRANSVQDMRVSPVRRRRR